jgi:HAD superfamily hydrolase (TIGR01484 family)
MFRGGELYTSLALREKLAREIDVTVELKRALLRKKSVSEQEIEQTVPRPVVAAALANLFSSEFDGFVCDYDGTLVSLEARDELLEAELALQLERLLSAGICVAVITGRGGSAVEKLQLSINPSLHHLVYCYLNNGSVLKRLNEDEPLMIHRLEGIELIEQKLRDSSALRSCIARLKVAKYRTQITADLLNPEQAEKTLRLINETVADFQDTLQVKTSGHSVDIFPNNISKGTACNDFKERLREFSVNRQILIIGDSGQENGNDFELLQQRFSLSVDRLHWIPSTCFPVLNAEREPIPGPAATIDVLKRVVVKEQIFTLTERNIIQ